MGTGASKIVGGPPTLNRIELLRATKSPRFLMDRILRFILEDISDKDIFRLQDPETCKKFLILTADSLQKYFDEIELVPMRDRSGRLYFKRITDLTEPANPDLKATVAQNCLSIGYFYVRLLQIYIALALTIIDDETLLVGRPAIAARTAAARRSAPGARVVYKGGQGPFSFKSLVDAHILQESVLGQGRLRFTQKDSLQIEVRSDTSGVVSEEGLIQPLQQPMYGYQGHGQQKTMIGIRLESPSGRPQIKIEQIATPGRSPSSVNIIIPLQEGTYNPTDYRLGTLAQTFERILSELSQGRTSTLDALRQQQASINSVAAAASRRGSVAPIPLQSSSANPLLDFRATLQALNKKPLAHCIARSFQLLNVDALGGQMPRLTRTNICKSRFMDEDRLPEGAAPRSPFGGREDLQGTGFSQVPAPREPISKVAGLNALNFLFFVLEKSVKLTDKTKVEYAAALTELSNSFGQQGKTYKPSDLSGRPDQMNEIVARDTCGSNYGREGIIKQAAAISKARSGVAALWGFQRSHAARVEALFKKLFAVDTTVKGQVGIGINPVLLKNGIPALEQVATETRVVLTDYYSQCEKIYQATVKEIGSSITFE
jgi:hypothetical protein